MNRQEYLLGKIAEEAAEVAQMALKCQQFGLDDRYQNGPDNAERLRGEITDLLTCIGMVVAETSFECNVTAGQMSAEKADKVNRYWDYINDEPSDQFVLWDSARTRYMHGTPSSVFYPVSAEAEATRWTSAADARQALKDFREMAIHPEAMDAFEVTKL